jgi:hypothetical protein
VKGARQRQLGSSGARLRCRRMLAHRLHCRRRRLLLLLLSCLRGAAAAS